MPRVWLCSLFAACLQLSAAPLQLFVGPRGDDGEGVGWSVKRPYRTLERAALAVRRLRGSKRGRDGITINLLPGTYRLKEALVLDPRMSGLENGPTTFRATVKGEATITGAETVTGWQLGRDGIWQAKVEATAIRTVYWAGERLPAARVPNVDPERPRTGGLLYAVTKDPETPKTALLFAAGDLDVSRWQHPETGRVVVWPGKNWNCDLLPIQSVDAKARRLTFKRARYDIVRGNRFYVEHIFEELDAPGEWLFDAKAQMLYLKPPVAGNPGQQVAIPRATNLIRLAGTREQPVQHVVLAGLRLQGSARHAVELSAAWHCAVRACEITRTGTDGVVLQEGSSQNRIVGCDIAWTGTNGIRLHGVRDTTRTRTDGMHGNVIENNHVHHVGMSGNAGGAIDVDPYCGGNITHDNLIRRNEIHDAPRKGVMFGGIRNVVEGNHIHHTNLEQSDTGAIGLCTRDLTEVGNVIRHNYLHDVGGYNMLKPGEWAFPSFCWGIYLDDWSSGVTVAGNVVVGAPSGAIHVHGGIDNVIENNILLDSPGAHILFSPIAPKTQDGKTYTMAGNRVRRNVAAGPATSAWLAGRKEWRKGIAECDRNLLWFGQGDPMVRNGRSKASSWAEWQGAGYDRQSVVARAKPVQVTKGRHQVTPELAAKIDFQPIPWDKVGLYESPDRFSWPVRTAWPREAVLLAQKLPAKPVVTVSAALPRLAAGRKPPVIDGVIGPVEWQGAGTLLLARDHRDRAAKPQSTARVYCDAKALYLALDNPISVGKALHREDTWGKGDAMEVALRPADLPEGAPILILHGYLNGRIGAAKSGGMSAEQVVQANQACLYGVKTISPTRWTAEITVPWAIVPGAKGSPLPLQFNVTCRKVADDLWLMWRPTGRRSYGVGEEGKLVPAH
ncbi:MAG: hypothetical protein HN849_32610 [Victivallales bacterium]|nr:hypothetical protein [Victivallales bacterium]